MNKAAAAAESFYATCAQSIETYNFVYESNNNNNDDNNNSNNNNSNNNNNNSNNNNSNNIINTIIMDCLLIKSPLQLTYRDNIQRK